MANAGPPQVKVQNAQSGPIPTTGTGFISVVILNPKNKRPAGWPSDATWPPITTWKELDKLTNTLVGPRFDVPNTTPGIDVGRRILHFKVDSPPTHPTTEPEDTKVKVYCATSSDSNDVSAVAIKFKII